MTEAAEMISPREAYDIASSWGSMMTAGDPGAVFYTFPTSDATPQGEAHRAQLIAYAKACRADLAKPAFDDEREELAAELDSLIHFFETMPATGEEFRETYREQSQALITGASKFALGYLTAAVWLGVELPDNHPDKDSDKLNGLDPADIHPDALASMIAECAKFETDNADLLADAYARAGYGKPGEYTSEEMAGHDFWLTRNHHGAGFWDRDALEEGGLGDKLTEAAHACGESDLYQGDDGGIYES